MVQLLNCSLETFISPIKINLIFVKSEFWKKTNSAHNGIHYEQKPRKRIFDQLVYFIVCQNSQCEDYFVMINYQLQVFPSWFYKKSKAVLSSDILVKEKKTQILLYRKKREQTNWAWIIVLHYFVS